MTRSDYMLLHEAAALLGVHPKTIARWADAGKLPSYTTFGGGHRRVLRSAVLAAAGRPA